MKCCFHFLAYVLLILPVLGFSWEISKLSGEALIDGKGAKVSDLVPVQSVVEAKGVKSFVELKNGEEVIRLYNGKMKMTYALANSSKKESGTVELIIGKIFLALNKIKDPKASEFKVKTKSATMGVRGTKFFVEEEEQKSYLCVCEGVVEAKYNKGKVKSVMVAAGDDLDILKEGQTLEVKRASKMMTDMSESIFAEMGVPVHH